jgi:hypothetical protein
MMFRHFSNRSLVLALLLSVQAGASELCVTQDAGRTELSLCGGDPFHSTEAEVTDARLVTVPDSSVLLVLWNERSAGPGAVPYYAISLDGQEIALVRRTSYELKLKYGRFDPLRETPAVDPALAADASSRLYIVQFAARPFDDFRQGVAALGGKVRSFVPNQGYVVEMSEAVKAQVETLPYVRWVGPFQPAYRLERFLCDNLDKGDELFPLQRYNIRVFERGLKQKTIVVQRIEALGATVDNLPRGGFLLDATLTPDQLITVVHFNEVAFLARWSPPEHFMDIARGISGANFVETVRGSSFTGR